jgi:putative Mn2+ efflux pump MntP
VVVVAATVVVDSIVVALVAGATVSDVELDESLPQAASSRATVTTVSERIGTGSSKGHDAATGLSL